MEHVCTEYITSQSKAGGKAVWLVAIAKLTNEGYTPQHHNRSRLSLGFGKMQRSNYGRDSIYGAVSS